MPVANTRAKVARRAAMTGRRRRNQPLEASGWIRGVVLLGLTGQVAPAARAAWMASPKRLRFSMSGIGSPAFT